MNKNSLSLGVLSLWAFVLPINAQTTVAGFTPGSFRVTESGAAEYRIPIRVPPGIGGMEPKLALVYNSQGGNGLLGVGWNLEGLSAIGRCPRTMAQDGVRGGVNYDANDRFCADGQRLMAISGAYGADGTEYRTERESFTRVISYGTAGNGPAWFKAWTKAGQIIEYGFTDDSRIEAQGKTTVRVWAANKVSDTKGNYLTVSYSEDSVNGELAPSRIDYSGTGGLGPTKSVRLLHETRTDVVPLYHAGSLMKQVKRLRALSAYDGEVLVHEYKLAYDYGGHQGKSRLLTSQECIGDGACFSPVSMNWTASVGDNSWAETFNIAAQNGYYVHWNPFFGDFNGDGLTDILWVYTSYYSQASAGYHTLWLALPGGGYSIISNVMNSNGYYVDYIPHVADFNGDGKADILWDYSDVLGRYSRGYRNLWLSNGDGTFVSHSNVGGANTMVGYKPLFGDFDGDGRIDILWDSQGTYGYNRSEGYRVLWMNNGDATFTAMPNLMGMNGYYNGYGISITDFNGDGKADLLWDYRWPNGRSAGNRVIWLGNGDGTFSILSNVAGLDGSYVGFTAYLGDFNGDGKTDIFWDYQESLARYSLGTHYVWLGRGDGTFQISPYTANSGYAYLPIVADFNGDGKSDIFWDYNGNTAHCASEGYRRLWLSKGDASFTAITNLAGKDGSYSGYKLRIVDLNGDGKTDVLWDGAQDGYCSSNGTRFMWTYGTSDQDLVASIVDSRGVAHGLSYKPLTDPLVYTRDIDGAYPIVDVQAPLRAVHSVVSDDGVGGTQSTSFRFGGLKAEVGTGRGLLGFRWAETAQDATGLKVRREARQDWPYVGLPSLVKKTHGAGAVLSEATNSFECKDPATGIACTVAPGNRYFPFLSQSVELSNDLNGAALPTVTTTTQYDAFGNATSVVVSTGDGYSKATTNIYANDTGNWFLGRLIRSSVQSTAP